MGRRVIAVVLSLTLLGCMSGSEDPLPEVSGPSEDPVRPPLPKPEMEIDPPVLDFGHVLVGTRNEVKATITNTGTAQLVVTNIALDEGSSDEFSITSGLEAIVVAPGANITTQVTFSPTQYQAVDGALRVESNHSTNPVFKIPLVGTGVSQPVPEIDVDPLSVNYREVLIGNTKSLDIAIRNTGSATLNVTRIAFAVGSSPDFEMAAAPPTGEIAPRASLEFRVSYRPREVGSDNGKVVIESNDADEGAVFVSLFGSGISIPEPEIVVSPLSLEFGEVLIGSWVSKEFRVSNTGTAVLDVSSIRLDTGTSKEFAIVSGSESVSILPRTSVTVRVTYTPTDEVADSRTIRIESNDADEGVVRVSLSGIGVPVPVPEIDVAPLSVEFGEVFLGSSSSRAAIIRNTGTLVLDVASIQLDAGASDEFAISSGPASAMIDPGDSLVVEVTYTPTDENFDSATLQIESNDANEPTVLVSLAGTGVPEEEDPGDLRSITLYWEPPEINADGSTLVDLSGFKLYDGPSSHQYTAVTDVGDATSYTLSLPPGRYYIAATAYDFLGNESAFSEEIVVTVR